jgi:hypothetical protein
MINLPETCSDKLSRKELLSHFEGCISQQREGQSHLVAHLRGLVRKRLLLAPPPSWTPNMKDCLRILRDIDKAYQRGKEAEALFESLISRFANGVF